MERWVDKIAVVTGASAGIGASIAEKLVEAGVQVVGVARRLERLEELSKKFSGKKGKFIPLKGDLADKDDILRVFKHISENIGPVSIGETGARNIDEWKKVLDTNIYGVAVATREAIKSMQENNIEGHIININSTLGNISAPVCDRYHPSHTGTLGHQVLNVPYMNVYPASKFAVTGFTETLRYELLTMGSKIKTTSISPGLVMTEIFEASGWDQDEELMKRLQAAPHLKPEDIANGVMYALETPPHVQSISPGLVLTEIFEASGWNQDEEFLKQTLAAPQLKPEDIANGVTYAQETHPHVQLIQE